MTPARAAPPGVPRPARLQVEEFKLPVRIGGHLHEDFEADLNRIEKRRLGYVQRMSTVLGRRVWENAGNPEVDTNRLAVSIGTGMGATEALVFAWDDMRERGMAAVSPLAVQMYMPNGPAAAVGLDRHAKAGVITPVSACASGSEGIAQAWRQIVLGEADVAICGGVENRIEAVPIAARAPRCASCCRTPTTTHQAPAAPSTATATASSSARAAP